MNTSARMPVAFIPHGGGPWPFVDLGFPKDELDSLATYLRELPRITPTTPKALLIISAHWEEQVPTVMSSARPPMLYDYGGFPPESYQLKWPAPGQPELGSRVRALLGAAGFATAEDSRRGFDHGTFIPMMLAYPAADIPTVQLSLLAGLDPGEHLKLGRALAPLRDEGVFIIGSGMSFHNFSVLRNRRAFPNWLEDSTRFDDWLQQTNTAEPAERDALLSQWAQVSNGRYAHPREEHLLPLMVIAGAAGSDRGKTAWAGRFMGIPASGYHFG